MPGLNPSPFEATSQAQTKRRVWAHPDLTSHSLLALTTNLLYLAPHSGETKTKPETLAAIDAGADLENVFGPLAVVIDLFSIRRLHLDLLENSLVIEYRGSGQGTSRQRISFATPEAADACFTKIWRRLGEDYELAPYKRDTWALAQPPLLLLLGALFVTALLVLLLNVFQDSDVMPDSVHFGTAPAAKVDASTSGGLHAWLDWRVVCAVGGMAAAVSQVWLFRRLTAPPLSLELIRR
jgi:hypothetical protein